MSTMLKTKTSHSVRMPSPEQDAAIALAAQTDQDAPILTDAQWTEVQTRLQRGRPLGSGRKTQITLRIDTDVLNKFKATGSGWQSRINEALKAVKV